LIQTGLVDKKKNKAMALFRNFEVPSWKNSRNGKVSYSEDLKYSELQGFFGKEIKEGRVKEKRNEVGKTFFKNIIEVGNDNPLVEKNFGKIIPPERGKLAAMNYGFINSGSVVFAEENEETGLLECTYLSEGNQFSHTLIVAEENSSVSLVENHFGNSGLKSSVVEIIAGRNSRVDYFSTREYGNCHSSMIVRAVASEGAEVNLLNASLGGEYSRNEIETVFKGEGSSGTNKFLFLGKKGETIDLVTLASHEARKTSCNTLVKGVLTGDSKTIYKGGISISKNARGSSSGLNEKVLLLGKGASSKAIPKLNIENNGVNASHGASCEYLDDSKLFYARSRGIKEREATAMMAQGFLGEVIGEAPKEFQEVVEEKVKRRLVK
jgi:Fe-S cluster assembly scaffold protein SufB